MATAADHPEEHPPKQRARSSPSTPKPLGLASSSVLAIHDAYLQGSPEDAQVVDSHLARLADRPKRVQPDVLAGAYFESSIYFDSIGNLERALYLGERGLEVANASCNQSLMRRAHNVLGINHFRLCNFAASCEHLELSLRYAAEQNDKFAELATLANIGSLLAGIGLEQPSRQIALKIASYPSNSPKDERLHFQNAVNALRWCAHSRDAQLGDYFLSIAFKTYGTATPELCETAFAYFEANVAEYLLSIGDVDLAGKHLSALRARSEGSANIHVLALSGVSLARYHLQSGAPDEEALKSIACLRSILPRAKSIALHYEETLCALIELTMHVRAPGEEVRRYGADLRDHLIKQKHREFFTLSDTQIVREFSDLLGPVHRIPKVLSGSDSSELVTQKGRADEWRVNDKYEERMTLALTALCPESLSWRSVSRNYAMAEDWAVAAELTSESDRFHSLRVAGVARKICQILGCDERTTEMVAFAARLHDIGKIKQNKSAMGSSRHAALGDWNSNREHTKWGHEILALADDDLMRFAAEVAHQHHEWWNGCGLPEGKRGSEISFGARVCSVANCFGSFLEGPEGWPCQAAVDQIETMAGVQLDPAIVLPFVAAVRSGEMFGIDELSRVH